MPKNQLKNPKRTQERDVKDKFTLAVEKLSQKLFGSKTKDTGGKLFRRSLTVESELKDKLRLPVKALSKHVYNNRSDIPEQTMLGYKVPAGELKGPDGNMWQLQLYAYRSKKDFIKKNEIIPIVSKWAIGFKLRVFAQLLVTKLFFSDETVKK